MTAVASPWDALLRAPAAKATAALPGTKSETLTHQLLRVIDEHAPIETHRLCVYCDLDSRNVWGLLKSQRSIGRVVFKDGAWAPGSEYLPPKVARAANLLRSLGWTVKGPQ